MSIHSWSKAGYSYGTQSSITTTYRGAAATADTTNSPESFRFPDRGNVQTVEIYFTGLSGTGQVCTMYLSRDSAGDVGVTPITNSASQVIQSALTTGSAGFAAFEVGRDFHFDSSVASTTSGTIYVMIKLDGGTATAAAVRVNWRA